MDFGSADSTKRQAIVDFVAVMARLLSRGNGVGALVYTGRLERMIPCRTGRLHVLRLINDLLKLPALPRSAFTDLTVLLEAARAFIRRRSLIFVLSDFLSAPGWERVLRVLSTRHEMVGVRVSDRSRERVPDVDPSIPKTPKPVSSSTSIPETAVATLVDVRHTPQLRAACSTRPTLRLSTDDDLASIVRFQGSSSRRRRQPAQVA
jgi:uncharacterized protein (DUF58 family)